MICSLRLLGASQANGVGQGTSEWRGRVIPIGLWLNWMRRCAWPILLAQLIVLVTLLSQSFVQPAASSELAHAFLRDEVGQRELWQDVVSRPRRLLQTTSSSSSVSHGSGSVHRPIRITPVFHLNETATAGTRIRDVILPQALARVTSLIGILEPVSGPLKLPRPCQQSWVWTDGSEECAVISPIRSCGSVQPDPTLYDGYTLCDGVVKGSCTETESGAGVDATDFILFVTMDDGACAGHGEQAEYDTVASADYCVQDVTTRRPLSGYINFCESAFEEV